MDANTVYKDILRAHMVSIHAPMMDANIDIAMEGIEISVSIHAPVMDAKRFAL